MDCKDDKAPGQMNLTLVFFQNNWKTIKVGLIIFNEFQSSSSPLLKAQIPLSRYSSLI